MSANLEDHLLRRDDGEMEWLRRTHDKPGRSDHGVEPMINVRALSGQAQKRSEPRPHGLIDNVWR
jgi:hypothetical protein